MNDLVLPSLSIFGVDVNLFASYQEAIHAIKRRMLLGHRTFCVAINPEKLQRSRYDVRLRRVLDLASIKICDGVGVSLASRLLHGTNIPRCTGVDLFLHLLRAAESEKWSIFLLGATAESNRSACLALRRALPALSIAGSRDGFFDDDESMVDEINSSGADLLFVALGSPRQEYWIADNMARLNPRFVMGVGGSLDVLSGSARRAPALVRRLGAEWLFRLLSEPARARRQQALPAFAVSVIRSAISASLNLRA